MPISIYHPTPADGTFTTAGASAWNEVHSVVGAAEQSALDVLSADLVSAKDRWSTSAAAFSVDIASVKGVLSNTNSAVAANSAQMTSADNAISAAVAVVSAAHTSLAASVAGALSAIAANSAQMTSADNAISNAVSIVSAAAAALSNVVSNRTSAITANSAQMTSADNAISNAVSIVSVAAANALSVGNAVSNRLSTWTLDNLANVSAPAPTSSQVLKFNSVAGQWVASADATGGAGGSVTSAEVVDAVSVEAANRTSADNLISQAVSLVSAAQAVTSAAVTSVNAVNSNQASAITANSAQMTSADNAISAAVASLASVMSSRTSAIQANSAQMTSADNAISNAVSIVSAATASLASVMSSRTSAIQANSAQMTSADNAISQAVSLVSAAQAVTSAAVTSVNQIVSALSQRLSALVLDSIANVSAGSPGDQQVLTWNSAAAQWVASTITAGVGSVTSAEVVDAVSVETANRVSANNVISNTVSALGVSVTAVSNAVSILSDAHTSLVNRVSANSGTGGAASVTSNELSVKAPWTAAQIRIMSTQQSTTGSALVDLSGLVLTVAGGERWEVDGMVAFSTSAAGAGLRMGWSVPPLSTPRFGRFILASGAQSAGIGGGAAAVQVSGNSILLSATTMVAGAATPVTFRYIFDVASAGTIRLMACGIASTTASPLQILAGSYFKAFRLK